MEETSIEFAEGWNIIAARGFKPLAEVLDEGGDYRRRHGAAGPSEWSEIYTTVYKMCIQKPPRAYASDLYDKVQETLKSYLRDNALPALTDLHGEQMLRELGRRWSNHKLMVKWVTRTFSYIDRYYVKRHEKRNLETTGYACFKEEVFAAVSDKLRTAALNMLQKERDGETIDRSLLKNVLGIFAEMGMGKLDVYTREWEEPFLAATAQFYRRTSAQWAAEESFPQFMEKADRCISDELDRASQYLNPQTQERLLKVCEQEILVAHQQQMLDKENSGLVALLQNNKREDLNRLCRLYRRVPKGLNPIGAILKQHIQKEGMELVREQRARIEVANEAAAKAREEASGQSAAQQNKAASHAYNKAMGNKPDFIQSLLSLHDRYSDIVVNCFDNQPVFNKAMKDAFERFVNEQVGEISTAQLFANFCDSLLNSTGIGSKMSENEVEAQLEKLVKLFTYLSEKDVFQEFCRKQLAKRLLHEKSHSDDAERFLISKLKQGVGIHATSKLEGMITDIHVSKDTQHQFVIWAADKSDVDADPASSSSSPGVVNVEGVDFSVRVLTTGHWPSYTESKIILPPKLEACTSLFNAYYHNRTSQRVLRWLHGLGKASIETELFVRSGKMELSVSTHQLCVLVLFNDADQLTYGEILDSIIKKKDDNPTPANVAVAPGSNTNVDLSGGEDAVKAALVSMMSKKIPLLIKEPKGREFNRTNTFRLNLTYSSPRRKVTIPTPTAKISEAEKTAVHETVVEDRRHAIEAAIVRVMKQRKTLDHQMLVMEVSRLCNPVFKPEPRAVKNRIEELINREFLAREENSTNTYKYLA